MSAFALGVVGSVLAWRWPSSWHGAFVAAKALVRYLVLHTGLPALLVTAVLIVLSYRILRRSFRFAVEVAVIALVLLAVTELGWVRW